MAFDMNLAGSVFMFGDGRFGYVATDGNKYAIYMWIEGTSLYIARDPKKEAFHVEGELMGAAQIPVKN